MHTPREENLVQQRQIIRLQAQEVEKLTHELARSRELATMQTRNLMDKHADQTEQIRDANKQVEDAKACALAHYKEAISRSEQTVKVGNEAFQRIHASDARAEEYLMKLQHATQTMSVIQENANNAEAKMNDMVQSIMVL